MENYLAEKYKPELLGQGEMQNALVRDNGLILVVWKLIKFKKCCISNF